MKNLYSITFSIPRIEHKTIRVLAADDSEAITIAKDKLHIDAAAVEAIETVHTVDASPIDTTDFIYQTPELIEQ